MLVLRGMERWSRRRGHIWGRDLWGHIVRVIVRVRVKWFITRGHPVGVLILN